MSSASQSVAGSDCIEKAQLLRDYEAAASGYARTVTILSAYMPMVGGVEYRAIVDRSEAAREKTEAAREAFEAHIREHGCL